MKTELIDLFFKERNQSTPLAKPIIIAHRGASGYEPENTLRSFKRAIAIGLEMQETIAIELDVFTCYSTALKKPVIVVIHDNTIDRTTNGHGTISGMTWEELKKYDAGKGERIPLLSQVLDMIDPSLLKYLILNIELKDPFTAQPVAELLYHYIHTQQWNYNNFIVSSFIPAAIKEFHQYLPEIKTGAIFYRKKAQLVQATLNAQAQYLIADYSSVTHDLIQEAHSKGLHVFTYTVNDTFIAQELTNWGVDGIITDYPDILSTLNFDTVIFH